MSGGVRRLLSPAFSARSRKDSRKKSSPTPNPYPTAGSVMRIGIGRKPLRSSSHSDASKAPSLGSLKASCARAWGIPPSQTGNATRRMVYPPLEGKHAAPPRKAVAETLPIARGVEGAAALCRQALRLLGGEDAVALSGLIGVCAVGTGGGPPRREDEAKDH